MRWLFLPLLCGLVMVATVPVPAQPKVLLLLPSPVPIAHPEAQEVFVAAFATLGSKGAHPWLVVTFHKESPSFQRAQREGKLPPEALTQPHEHAERLCVVEGAQGALWVRVTRAEGKVPRAIEAQLLVPSSARFASDIDDSPMTEEERQALRPLAPRTPTPEQVLALRLGRWLRELLSPPPESKPSESPPVSTADLKAVEALFKEGRWEEAVLLLNQLIAETPTDAALYLRLGQAYEEKQRWEDAFLEYRRAVQLQPDLWVGWKGIARTAVRRNRWQWVLEASRQLRKTPEKDPEILLWGARAAWTLADDAQRKGRDRDAESLRREASTFYTDLIAVSQDLDTLLEAAERLLAHKRTEAATLALTKAIAVMPNDPSVCERVLLLAGSLKRIDLAYQALQRCLSAQSPTLLSLAASRVALAAMDQEIVRLFERVRVDLAAFDGGKLTREDLLARLQKVNEEAEQLLRVAHALRFPMPLNRSHDRRLLGYELFLQATGLLLQWVEQPDDLTRRRAVVLYEFARSELEQAWSSTPRTR